MNADGIVGQVLDGKYSIEKQLGQGGMGTVYLSTHIGTGRPVAVKVIAPDFMKRQEFVERFRREARAAGRLRHPNVVDVTDFGFAKTEGGENVAYLVMEYLDGCTLGEVLDEEKKLPVEFSIDILEQVCSAVEEAHKQGIIHRDLKPDNIWLEPNQRGGYTVKVLDFGIAKLEEAQLEDLAHSLEISSSNVSKTALIREKQTSVDESQSETVIDKKSSTVIGENETVALIEESKTLVPETEETGTMIQNRPDNDNSEDGTAILPINKTKISDKEEDSKGTKILGDPDEKGTKILSEGIETDKKPLHKTSSTADLTRVGAVLGTPLYMSPEQCRGEKLTPRSDIYSLAVIIYQMLSGNLPFTGDYVKVMDGHKTEEPPPLKAKKVPKKLKGIVMQSLSKDAEDRPESAQALASKLRSNSEGLWQLLTRSVVIYSERLPKFLALSVLTFIPLIILTFARVGVNFTLRINEVDSGLAQLFSAVLGISSFFLQIVTSALLVGMITWVVAQTIAFPLRPISLRAAFREIKKRWKPLTGTVTLSTLLSFISFGIGGIAGILGWILPVILVYVYVSNPLAILLLVITSTLGFILLGVIVSSLFMLIAPSIMMEDISGKAAFRRSVELVRRSFSTVFATSILVYVLPVFLSIIIGLSVGSIIGNIQKSSKIAEMEREGVPAKQDADKTKDDFNITFGNKGLELKNADPKEKKKEEKDMRAQFGQALTEGIFEIIWTPLAILISSFTSVITALIYFKTRQAGGESMQGLLGKLDESDKPQSKWQQRVRERLIQSGKISDTTNPSKP